MSNLSPEDRFTLNAMFELRLSIRPSLIRMLKGEIEAALVLNSIMLFHTGQSHYEKLTPENISWETGMSRAQILKGVQVLQDQNFIFWSDGWQINNEHLNTQLRETYQNGDAV